MFSISYQIKNLPLQGWSLIIFLDQTEGSSGAKQPIDGSVRRSEAPEALSESIRSQSYTVTGRKNKIEKMRFKFDFT